MTFGLAHGALEPEQEAIIEEGWMIDAICLADQRVGEAAEVDEAVPIGVVARQARDLESEHEADVGECDLGGEAGGTPTPQKNRTRGARNPLHDEDRRHLATQIPGLWRERQTLDG